MGVVSSVGPQPHGHLSSDIFTARLQCMSDFALAKEGAKGAGNDESECVAAWAQQVAGYVHGPCLDQPLYLTNPLVENFFNEINKLQGWSG